MGQAARAYGSSEDTGAQPERTALAWARTAAAHVAGTAIGLRLSLTDAAGRGVLGDVAAVLLLVGLLVSLALLLRTLQRRAAIARRWSQRQAMVDVPSVVLATAAATATALAGLVLVLA